MQPSATDSGDDESRYSKPTPNNPLQYQGRPQSEIGTSDDATPSTTDIQQPTQQQQQQQHQQQQPPLPPQPTHPQHTQSLSQLPQAHHQQQQQQQYQHEDFSRIHGQQQGSFLPASSPVDFPFHQDPLADAATTLQQLRRPFLRSPTHQQPQPHQPPQPHHQMPVELSSILIKRQLEQLRENQQRREVLTARLLQQQREVELSRLLHGQYGAYEDPVSGFAQHSYPTMSRQLHQQHQLAGVAALPLGQSQQPTDPSAAAGILSSLGTTQQHPGRTTPLRQHTGRTTPRASRPATLEETSERKMSPVEVKLKRNIRTSPERHQRRPSPDSTKAARQEAGSEEQASSEIMTRPDSELETENKDEEQEGKEQDDRRLDTFPHKLHRMISFAEETGKGDIISFLPNGRIFEIHKPREFAADLMPQYFSTTRLASFHRQLSFYGFRRVSEGQNRVGYYHEYFVKGDIGLCKKIKRRVLKKPPKPAPADTAAAAPASMMAPNSTTESYLRALHQQRFSSLGGTSQTSLMPQHHQMAMMPSMFSGWPHRQQQQAPPPPLPIEQLLMEQQLLDEERRRRLMREMSRREDETRGPDGSHGDPSGR